MQAVVTADIVLPCIIITAICIAGWILEYLWRREAERRADKLCEDFWDEHDFAGKLAEKCLEFQDRIYWLEELIPPAKEETSTEKRIQEASTGPMPSAR